MPPQLQIPRYVVFGRPPFPSNFGALPDRAVPSNANPLWLVQAMDSLQLLTDSFGTGRTER